MATHSSVLALRIPAMGEPGGLPSMGSHRVGHDWSDVAAVADENSEKVMATLSCTLQILWLEEPDGLQSMGSLRFGTTSLSIFTVMHWRRKWQPNPVFLPGESQGWGSWWAAVYWVAQSQTRLKWLSSRRKCVLDKMSRERLSKKMTLTEWSKDRD